MKLSAVWRSILVFVLRDELMGCDDDEHDKDEYLVDLAQRDLVHFISILNQKVCLLTLTLSLKV